MDVTGLPEVAESKIDSSEVIAGRPVVCKIPKLLRRSAMSIVSIILLHGD